MLKKRRNSYHFPHHNQISACKPRTRAGLKWFFLAIFALSSLLALGVRTYFPEYSAATVSGQPMALVATRQIA